MHITDEDRARFASATHTDLARILGAHTVDGGVRFAVWAPNADRVDVIGDWNGWDADESDSAIDSLRRDESGIWHGVIAAAAVGDRYKYEIFSPFDAEVADKADPFAFSAEEAPDTASVITDLSYTWGDDAWMNGRAKHNGLDAPMSVYELHLGSWRYEPGGYRAIAHQLADYLDETGFTHVELLPVMEHPYYASWGYQTLGYFAPSSRYGSPQDFKYFVDHLHQRGHGVILDWVPSHFPTDAHGLAMFDGTHLYEHADPRLGFHPDWKSCIFNYDRPEVQSFLVSSAMFWLDEYHVDGIRVDAVASMLYRDYSRNEGEWIPNEHGGRENTGAVTLLRRLNETIYGRHPDVAMIAEESTAWEGVSSPTFTGGLGFGMKWDMGWMHDTLRYLARNPVHRRYHHNELTFRSMYAFTENFLLPLSHDEVVHGKSSLVNKMPGDRWQQLANLRLLYGYQWGSPGKKLLFMGSEFAVSDEWDHQQELSWELLQYAEHHGVKLFVSDLNRLLRREPSLHRVDFEASGFRWIVGDDEANSVLVFERLAPGQRPVVVVINCTPKMHESYRIGVAADSPWRELLNSDSVLYGGSGVGNPAPIAVSEEPAHGQSQSIEITIPPLSAVFLAPSASSPARKSSPPE